MDRSEALARLHRTTRFQFVGERLVMRDVAILKSMDAIERVEEENGAATVGVKFTAPGYELAAA